MTDRKFTPPTTFSAEYVDGRGHRVILLGFSEDGDMLIGYYPSCNVTGVWGPDGSHGESYNDEFDLHDIPKRVKRYEVRYKSGQTVISFLDMDNAVRCLREDRYITLYECDEDGSNPTITRIQH